MPLRLRGADFDRFIEARDDRLIGGKHSLRFNFNMCRPLLPHLTLPSRSYPPTAFTPGSKTT
jgi:hypothetical protein